MTDSDSKQDTAAEPMPQAAPDGAGPTDAPPAGPPSAVGEGPAPAAPFPSTASADDEPGEALEGQWVWQFAAPPPPPPWSAALFSGGALKELYRFFACGLLVVIGCLLPWGPVLDVDVNPPELVQGGAPIAVEHVLTPPPWAGYETPAGAISLVLGLWLVFSAAYGIYTGRQKILPVFLMIEPAIVTWWRTFDAVEHLPEAGFLEHVQQLFMIGGSGVLLTLVGSTIVALNFIFLVGKVYTKKDDKGAARRSSRGGKSGADKGAAGEIAAATADGGTGEGEGARSRRGRRR